MRIFDSKRTRRPGNPSGSNGTELDLEKLREQVPDVEGLLEQAENLSTEEETQASGCGCW